jgi:putative intracellular protease/amidase
MKWAKHVFVMLLGLFLAISSSSSAFGADAAKPAEAKKPMTVGVVLYPGFEVLDVFGPVEMFMSTGPQLMRVVMVAEKAGPVASGPPVNKEGKFSGPEVVAEYGFDNAPQFDILMVPGGNGTLNELKNDAYLNFLKQQSEKAQLTTSVCSGSALLAKAGLLDGRKATCNKAYFNLLIPNGPKVDWQPKARWVEDGKFVTSSGVSAGTDMALAIIAKLFGEDIAKRISTGTEYVWSSDPDNDPFAKLAAK